MKCKECQEYILTDYVDDQLNEEVKREIHAHLSSCRECREFSAMAQKTAIEPFEKCERLAPRETVWQNIKNEITKDDFENQADWLSKLKNALFPRPVFVFATVCSFILMVIALNPKNKHEELAKNGAQKQDVIGENIHSPVFDLLEEISYVAYLAGEDEDSSGYGTSIEEYFL